MEQEFLEAILKRYERDHKTLRVLWVKSEPAVAEGENYLSIVTRIKAGVIIGKGAKRTISVVIKSAIQDNAAGQWTINSGVFDGEAKFYNNILDKMNELMYEFDDRRERLWAELIAFQSQMMVFRDLKMDNFTLVKNRCDCLDLAHSKLVVRSLARLHAMSKVLLRRHSISPTDVQTYPIVAGDFPELLYANGLKILAREMKPWGPEWADICERLVKASETLAEKLVALSKVDENNFNVINHGDCWISNIMFKYDPYENMPISLRFVDFQLSHYQSYGWDLVYFLYTSIHGDLRRKYYHELLSDYIATLRNTLLMYDYPDYQIPTLDDLHKEMERLNIFALPICTLTHPIMTMPIKNTYCFSEGLNPEKFVDCGYNLDIFKGRYKDEIGPDIRRFAELGVI